MLNELKKLQFFRLSRMVQKIEPPLSGRFPIVEIQHATEAFSALNWIVD